MSLKIKKAIIYIVLFLVVFFSLTISTIISISTVELPSQEIMGTNVSLKLIGIKAKKASQEIINECHRFEDEFSTAKKKENTSTVYRFNKAKKWEPIPVSDDFIAMYKIAEEMRKETYGVFDITSFKLTKLWKFDPDQLGEKGSYIEPPTEEQINYAKEFVGEQYVKEFVGKQYLVELDESKKTIIKYKDGVEIDFGAIAKGYMADKAKAICDKYGVRNGFIDLGGNLYILGSEKRIGVVDPRSDENDYVLGIVKLKEQSIVTSGDYERYYIDKYNHDTRYCHIIDAKTGKPKSPVEIISISVIGKSSRYCDAIATAAFLLGEVKGRALISKYDYDCIMVIKKLDSTKTYNVIGDIDFEYNEDQLKNKYAKQETKS